MKRIPILFPLVLTAAMLTGNAAEATNARLQALGGSGAYFEDDANVLRWYGSLADYPDRLVLDSGAFNLYWGYHTRDMNRISGPGGGLHTRLGENARWGTAAAYVTGTTRDTPFATEGSGHLNGSITTLYSRDIGPVSAALMFGYGSTSGLEQPGQISALTFDLDRSEIRYGAGMRMDLGETAYLDAAGEFRSAKLDETMRVGDEIVTETDGDAVDSFGIRSRVFVGHGDDWAWIPLLELAVEEAPISPLLAYGSCRVEMQRLRLGCGLNYFPDPDRFFFADFEYRRGDTEFFVETYDELLFAQRWRWDSIGCDFGAETRLLAWLTLRASCRYECRWEDETWTNPENAAGHPTDREATGAKLGADVGLGVHLGRFDLDLALTDELPQTPAGFIGISELVNETNWLTATLRATF